MEGQLKQRTRGQNEMVNLKEVRRFRAAVVWVFADVTGQSWTKVTMRRKDSFTERAGGEDRMQLRTGGVQVAILEGSCF